MYKFGFATEEITTTTHPQWQHHHHGSPQNHHDRALWNRHCHGLKRYEGALLSKGFLKVIRSSTQAAAVGAAGCGSSSRSNQGHPGDYMLEMKAGSFREEILKVMKIKMAKQWQRTRRVGHHMIAILDSLSIINQSNCEHYSARRNLRVCST